MATITGGEKLMAELARINGNLANAGDAPHVRVGFLEGATYPDGTSVASVAAWNEFGTSKAPPRPFFRRMIKTNAKGWPDAIASVFKSTGFNAAVTLAKMGELIKGQLQQSIVDLVDPVLAASTIRRKGFSKPLIDTGVMLRSVDYEVST